MAKKSKSKDDNTIQTQKSMNSHKKKLRGMFELDFDNPGDIENLFLPNSGQLQEVWNCLRCGHEQLAASGPEPLPPSVGPFIIKELPRRHGDTPGRIPPKLLKALRGEISSKKFHAESGHSYSEITVPDTAKGVTGSTSQSHEPSGPASTHQQVQIPTGAAQQKNPAGENRGQRRPHSNSTRSSEEDQGPLRATRQDSASSKRPRQKRRRIDYEQFNEQIPGSPTNPSSDRGVGSVSSPVMIEDSFAQRAEFQGRLGANIPLPHLGLCKNRMDELLMELFNNSPNVPSHLREVFRSLASVVATTVSPYLGQSGGVEDTDNNLLASGVRAGMSGMATDAQQCLQPARTEHSLETTFDGFDCGDPGGPLPERHVDSEQRKETGSTNSGVEKPPSFPHRPSPSTQGESTLEQDGAGLFVISTDSTDGNPQSYMQQSTLPGNDEEPRLPDNLVNSPCGKQGPDEVLSQLLGSW